MNTENGDVNKEEESADDVRLAETAKLHALVRRNFRKRGTPNDQVALVGAMLIVGELLDEEMSMTELYTTSVDLIGMALGVLVEDEDDDGDGDGEAEEAADGEVN